MTQTERRYIEQAARLVVEMELTLAAMRRCKGVTRGRPKELFQLLEQEIKQCGEALLEAARAHDAAPLEARVRRVA